ncbi:MAG: hypothetical protein P1P88_04860 [Bacteroidales bacterium]|nr:hypothetical protein [Bacteroidales bacterium]
MKLTLGFYMLSKVLRLPCKTKLPFQFPDLIDIAPFKGNTSFLCYPLAMLYHLLGKLPVSGEGDVFLLPCRIYSYLFYLFAHLLLSEQINALFKDLLLAILIDTLKKVDKVGGIKRIFVLKDIDSPSD